MAFYTHNGGEVTKHQAGSNLSEENDTPLAVMRLSCGRRFSYRVYGPPDGLPVLALHGTPGSNLKFRPASTVAATLGLRLIALDRWHYGLTDAPSTPSLAGFATDVGEIADQLEFARFAAIGISGGGPYAAAVAAQLGRRVTACALVAPVGPIAGVEPRPRLGLYHHVAFRILPRLPGVLPAAFGLLAGVSRRAPQLATRIAAGRAAPADRAIARDRDFALSLGQTFAAGLSRSARGPVIDMKLFSRPWPIDLAATWAPTGVWIGDQDRNVPIAAVEALVREHGRSRVARLPGHGHFWIAQHFPEVLGWIADRRP